MARVQCRTIFPARDDAFEHQKLDLDSDVIKITPSLSIKRVYMYGYKVKRFRIIVGIKGSSGTIFVNDHNDMRIDNSSNSSCARASAAESLSARLFARTWCGGG